MNLFPYTPDDFFVVSMLMAAQVLIFFGFVGFLIASCKISRQEKYYSFDFLLVFYTFYFLVPVLFVAFTHICSLWDFVSPQNIQSYSLMDYQILIFEYLTSYFIFSVFYAGMYIENEDDCSITLCTFLISPILLFRAITCPIFKSSIFQKTR